MLRENKIEEQPWQNLNGTQSFLMALEHIVPCVLPFSCLTAALGIHKIFYNLPGLLGG